MVRMINEEMINQSFDRVRNAGHKAIDAAFSLGIEVGIKRLAAELFKSDIDDIPFPSGLVKATAERLIEELRGENHE